MCGGGYPSVPYGAVYVVTAERGEYSCWEFRIVSAHLRRDLAEDARVKLEESQKIAAKTSKTSGWEEWFFDIEEIPCDGSLLRKHILSLIETGDLHEQLEDDDE